MSGRAGARPRCQSMCVASVLPTLALTLSAIVPLYSQAPTGADPTGSVAVLVAQYDSAWNRRDTAAVSRLLAPEYRYFTSRGDVSSRAETMTFLSAPGYVLKHAKRSELAVVLSGPVAVVSSRWQGQGSYRGEAFRDDQRCGQTWLRRGRIWQLLSEHCVQIAPAASAPSD